MQTIATRNVPPRLAGAASGVLNTLRQTGSALGSAIVLAVLQSQLGAGHSFVSSMRVAIAIPVAVLLVGAVLSLAVKPADRAAEAGGSTTVSSEKLSV
jgi:hypothetical protein